MADELATSLKSALLASNADATTNQAQVKLFDDLVTTAKVNALDAKDDEEGASAVKARAAIQQLQACVRSQEIPSLDAAAKILAGVTALITGLFTGLGFATGDFVRMYRDYFSIGLSFLLCAGIALLLGTFAFLINSYRSQRNLWFERIAIYFGVTLTGGAVVLAAVGLSLGASNGTSRPVISATISPGAMPTASLQVMSNSVPRSEFATVVVWGDSVSGAWNLLRTVVSGPSNDGVIDISIGSINTGGYSQLLAMATVGYSPTTTSSSLMTPSLCQDSALDVTTPACLYVRM